MIDSDELLAIGAALVDTVRSQIKYSTNMDEEGQLFDGLTNSKIYNFKANAQMHEKRDRWTPLNGCTQTVSLSTPTLCP